MNGKKRVMVAGVAAAVLAAPVLVLVSGVAGSGGAAHASSNTTASTSTAKVVRTDLASTQQVSGNIGYDGSYNVVNPAGANAQAVTQAQQQLAAAQAALANDQTSASDTEAGNTQSINQAQAAVNAAQATLSADQSKQSADCAGAGASGAACNQDGQKVSQDQAQLAQQQASLASAQLNATKATHQDQAKLASDNTSVQNAEAALAVVERTAANPGTTYTALPGLGQVITQGQSLYSIDGKPVPLFYGTTTMWRDFRLGMDDGPDVGELTANLIALGFGSGLTQSNHFSQATADAVSRWQASIGVPQTGFVRLGEVIFEPGPIRVSNVHGAVGQAASPGPVLDATTTNRIVTVALSVSKEYLVHTGDKVSVLLPDGKTTTDGHIRDISKVAQSGSGGSGGGGGSGPTVNITITLDHPEESGNLDQAPVNVNITDASVRGVLAVPINALLALSEGGDAVEVVSGGTRHLVAVHTGLYSDTMVEVSGPGITEGTLVEVPSS
jgi:hypothetical protein